MVLIVAKSTKKSNRNVNLARIHVRQTQTHLWVSCFNAHGEGSWFRVLGISVEKGCQRPADHRIRRKTAIKNDRKPRKVETCLTLHIRKPNISPEMFNMLSLREEPAEASDS